eukprot:TRINITY_DN1387_c0_g1_i1.p1 TRINITY_DN1387_c0_g1~~TRINITY_DN1387_c0_g1_i1.p1  ORF type:complete len:1052 (-),score=279.57 TRINITY_DN1387_c0_g1_i1:88-3243(-)
MIEGALSEVSSLVCGQHVGVKWLLEMYSKGVSSVLADDPGCGKTLQTLVFLSILLEMEKQNPGHSEIDSFAPVLIVCPLSVASQWESEMQRFTPFLRSLMYIGSKEERENLQTKSGFTDEESIFSRSHPVVVRGPDGKRLETRKPNAWDVLITHYSIILSDADFLSSIAWRFIVIDEAHRLKNSESRLYKCLKERFWLREGHISLLTGTPMQNNTSELWSLLHFLHPEVFTDRDEFVKAFPSDQSMMHSFHMELETSSPEYHEVLQPFILRRLKSVVLKDELPDRKEYVLKSSMSPIQMELYRKILMRDPEAFEKGVRLSNVLMQLRKCCNHPYMFPGVEEEPFELGEHIITNSAKMMLLDALLTVLRRRNRMVLIFSQFTHMLDIIQDYCHLRGFPYERLDGSVRGEERFMKIDSFQKGSDSFVFLISTRAGGLGLNLTSASTVIFFDSDWNPMVDEQAADRVYRIGQLKSVTVFRLLVKDTIDEIIYRRAQKKRLIVREVVERGGLDGAAGREGIMDKENLMEAIEFGLSRWLSDSHHSPETDEKAFDKMKLEEEIEQLIESLPGPSICDSEEMAEDDIQMEDLDVSDRKHLKTGGYLVKDEHGKEEKGVEQAVYNQNMYVFDGVDFRDESHDGLYGSDNDKRALLNLIMDAKAQSAPDLSRIRRLKMSDEEIAAMMQRKEEGKRKRKAEKWVKNGYKSHAIIKASERVVPSDRNDLFVWDSLSEEDGITGISWENMSEELQEADKTNEHIPFQFVRGDVLTPQSHETSASIMISVQSVDPSGNWGSGGLFTLISNRFPSVVETYEAAAESGDLCLGDVHVISISSSHMIALAVCIGFNKRTGLRSGVSSSSLESCLTKLRGFSLMNKCSVHLPRIGESMLGSSWYSCERVIRKVLENSVPSFVYYFQKTALHSTSASLLQTGERAVSAPHPEIGSVRRDDYVEGLFICVDFIGSNRTDFRREILRNGGIIVSANDSMIDWILVDDDWERRESLEELMERLKTGMLNSPQACIFTRSVLRYMMSSDVVVDSNAHIPAEYVVSTSLLQSK